MKSKPPTFHLGGLDAPVLQPFASRTTTKIVTSDPPALRILQASAKSLPSPAKFHHPARTSQTTEAKESMESDKAKEGLKEIFYNIGFSSKLFCEIHDSQFADQHIDRIGDSLGTGGLLMYLQVWNSGHAGAISTQPSLLKHHFPSFWITSTLQTFSRRRKIWNLQEQE